MLRKVFLTFPQALIEEPVLYDLAREFDIRTNIRGASVTPQIALVALEIVGDAPEIDRAIAHLEKLGVQVERLAE